MPRPRLIEQRVEAAHQRLVREFRVGLADELEQRLRGPQAEDRVDRDPGRGQQPDVRRAQERHVVPHAVGGRLALVVLGSRVGHAEAIDRPGAEIEPGVQEERHRSEEVPQDPRRDDAAAEPGKSCRLEPGHGPAPDQLVAGSRDRQVAQDRGHAGRARRAFQQPGPAEDEEVGRQAGQRHGDGAEDGPELHDLVVAQAGPPSARRSATARARRRRRSPRRSR